MLSDSLTRNPPPRSACVAHLAPGAPSPPTAPAAPQRDVAALAVHPTLHPAPCTSSQHVVQPCRLAMLCAVLCLQALRVDVSGEMMANITLPSMGLMVWRGAAAEATAYTCVMKCAWLQDGRLCATLDCLPMCARAMRTCHALRVGQLMRIAR